MSKSMLPQNPETVEISRQEEHELIAMRIRIRDAIWHLQQAMQMLDENNIKQQAKDVQNIIKDKVNAARRVA